MEEIQQNAKLKENFTVVVAEQVVTFYSYKVLAYSKAEAEKKVLEMDGDYDVEFSLSHERPLVSSKIVASEKNIKR